MTQTILNLIVQLAIAYNLDPLLIRSMVKVESNWNAKAIGTHGELGLLQVMPEFSDVDKESLLDPEINLIEGIKILQSAKKYCVHKYDFTYIVCYNKGIYGGSKIKNPKLDSYYLKVMTQYKKVKQ